ncbi:hypothetical protein VPH35_109777 [Triticum aestivum]
MSRRFLYMAVENLCASPVSHTVNRINPSRLFYPKAKERARAMTEVAAADAVKARLAHPSMTFSSSDVDNVVDTDFALIGRSKDKIVALHRAHLEDIRGCRITTQGSAVLYDDASHSFRALPDITATLPHGEVAPVAVGETRPCGGGWQWHSFPPPPVEGGAAGAYAVVDRSHIWASTRSHGTYSMDHGHGDRLWEGFTVPRGSYVRSHLVHLGDGGRFCVTKFFEMTKPPPASCCARCYYDNCPPEIGFAVLIGVEVERYGSGELRMIKHRSRKYSLGETRTSHAVL